MPPRSTFCRSAGQVCESLLGFFDPRPGQPDSRFDGCDFAVARHDEIVFPREGAQQHMIVLRALLAYPFFLGGEFGRASFLGNLLRGFGRRLGLDDNSCALSVS